MGVNTNIYLIYGWKLPYDDVWRTYDEETDYSSSLDGVVVYHENNEVFVGAILDESGDLRWNSPNFKGWSGSEEKALDVLNRTTISEKVEELTPFYRSEEPKFFLVTIYS